MRSNNSPLCPFCGDLATGDHFCHDHEAVAEACGGIEYPLIPLIPEDEPPA